MSEESRDNWLSAQLFECPACRASLYRVDHSPLCDDDRLYCDQCPRAVEISLHDARFTAIQRSMTDPTRRDLLVAATEPLLRACVCGGRFRDNAPRRCRFCTEPAVRDQPAGVDLYPGFVGEIGDREPTDAEQRRFDAFEAELVRKDDIWA